MAEIEFCYRTGKRSYETAFEARSERQQITHRRKQQLSALSVYKCWFCDQYHLGRPKPPEKGRR